MPCRGMLGRLLPARASRNPRARWLCEEISKDRTGHKQWKKGTVTQSPIPCTCIFDIPIILKLDFVCRKTYACQCGACMGLHREHGRNTWVAYNKINGDPDQAVSATAFFLPRVFFGGEGLGSFWAARRAEVRARTAYERCTVSTYPCAQGAYEKDGNTPRRTKGSRER